MIAILASGLCGFGLRDALDSGINAVIRPVSAFHDEFLTDSDSFSEAEAAKRELFELCTARILVLRRQLDFHPDPAIGSAPGFPDQSASRLDSTLADIDRAMNEFSGTDQVFRFHVLKWIALRRAGRNAEWLESYLTLLRQHPLNPTVGDYAERAIALGTEQGRQAEVIDALRLALDVPIQAHQRYAVLQALASAPSPPIASPRSPLSEPVP
ncbi:MAG: hypothetical protein JNK85_00520 [Verrucomicrobiales bacterium]|nr:hypothetical protein [Verrucomicrobiales bacterium]